MTRSSLQQVFTEHPASVGESYPEHFRAAAGFSFRLVGSGLACLVHAFVPALCRTTGSDAIETLYTEMVTRRRDAAPATRAAR